jgi:chemotaxis methyl-accepting protein methylase
MPDRSARRPGDLPGTTLPLAQGELNERDQGELRGLKSVIQRVVGLNCESYKEPCLRRRIAVRMRARGVHSYADYAELLQRDGGEAERLLDTITINVSKFFRNREVWDNIRTRVLPELFTLTGPLRIWSAGCAGGEEPYTIAMVLLRFAEEHGIPPRLLSRVEILATDIDRESLANAQRGEYGPFAFTEIEQADRDRFFEGNRIRAEVRRMVRFATLDLMNDPMPEAQHLIFCRNVIIYFERSMQETLFKRFDESLVSGGYLVLGKVETVFGQSAALFRPVVTRERIFRKP